ncbi:hypothetical protein IQ07DRAFT_590199 [Pyrenochaeta sp. DS3sAY3a]|nr:hypothetical protein IQ07DRAFT_590199 [Pyrenochaeta sp. DS3sAY3a]
MEQTELPKQPRRRSRLACDKCALARVRCLGDQPCRRCRENEHECVYERNVQKRGRKRTLRLPTDDTPGVSTAPTRSITSAVHHAHDDHDPIPTQNSDTLVHSLAASEENPSQTPDLSDHISCIGVSMATPSSLAQTPLLNEVRAQPPPASPYAQRIRHTDLYFDYATPIDLARDHHFPAQRSPIPPDDRYACLAPLFPQLQGILKPQLACRLLELYFAPSAGSTFYNASPYVITPVLRRESVLDPACTRPTTIALLATMIWVSAQTAPLPQLLAPGARAEVCTKLQMLVFQLQHERDQDSWHRVSGRHVRRTWAAPSAFAVAEEHAPPAPVVDDVLSLILITIVTSGGDFKPDCLMWWEKALRLTSMMRLHQLDHPDLRWDSDFVIGTHRDDTFERIRPFEAKEEMRRTFWLAFALDRHLALSYNKSPSIVDGEHYVYSALPEAVWERLDKDMSERLHVRARGPSAVISGTGFFEFFLPLMVLLGDITHLRRQQLHPHFGMVDPHESVALIEEHLENCKKSIDRLRSLIASDLQPTSEIAEQSFNHNHIAQGDSSDRPEPSHRWSSTPSGLNHASRAHIVLVTSYSYFILHVLHILLHGEWDAITMLAWSPPTGNNNNWVASASFLKCSSHAVLASEAVAVMLEVDPELNFMPYLLGIYLFHGSLVLLLFADRMPAVQGGPNDAVESACETIIRAHEACIVTLSTEFQRVFKRVMRATLTLVRNRNELNWTRESAAVENGNLHNGSAEVEVAQEIVEDMRKEMLRLYRWNCGGLGLGI